MGQEVFERFARPPLAQHRNDRVVAGDGAGDAGQRSLVDAPRDEVSGARRSPDHGHRLDELDRQHQLADEGRRAAVAAHRTDEAELLNVTRDGRLRRPQATSRERLSQLLLGVDPAAVHERKDRLVALSLGRGHPTSSTLCMIPCARSISSAVMISGGTRRIEFSSTALMISPASRQCS